MIIWKIVSDIDGGMQCETFADEATARAEYAKKTKAYWEQWMGDKPMPEDPDDAWDIISAESHCLDFISLDCDEVTLPPVYEAAPAMLAALHQIEDYLHRYDSGNEKTYADIFEIIDKAVAKAEGRAND